MLLTGVSGSSGQGRWWFETNAISEAKVSTIIYWRSLGDAVDGDCFDLSNPSFRLLWHDTTHRRKKIKLSWPRVHVARQSVHNVVPLNLVPTYLQFVCGRIQCLSYLWHFEEPFPETRSTEPELLATTTSRSSTWCNRTMKCLLLLFTLSPDLSSNWGKCKQRQCLQHITWNENRAHGSVWTQMVFVVFRCHWTQVECRSLDTLFGLEASVAFEVWIALPISKSNS